MPPNNDTLIQIYEEFIESHEWDSEQAFKMHNRLLQYLKHCGTDKRWHLGLLSQMTPDHTIWQPGYRPPEKPKPYNNPQMLTDPNGFFSRM